MRNNTRILWKRREWSIYTLKRTPKTKEPSINELTEFHCQNGTQKQRGMISTNQIGYVGTLGITHMVLWEFVSFSWNNTLCGKLWLVDWYLEESLIEWGGGFLSVLLFHLIGKCKGSLQSIDNTFLLLWTCSMDLPTCDSVRRFPREPLIVPWCEIMSCVCGGEVGWVFKKGLFNAWK